MHPLKYTFHLQEVQNEIAFILLNWIVSKLVALETKIDILLQKRILL